MNSLSPNIVFPCHYHSTCAFYTFLSWNLLFNRETNGRSLGIFQQKWTFFGNRWALRKISAFPFLFSSFKGFIFDKIIEKGVKGGIEASPRQSCSYFLRLSCVREVICSNLSWATAILIEVFRALLQAFPKSVVWHFSTTWFRNLFFEFTAYNYDVFLLVRFRRYYILNLSLCWWWKPLMTTICTWNWKYTQVGTQ